MDATTSEAAGATEQQTVTWGDRIKAYCEDKGLDRRSFAARCGLSVSSINQVVNGKLTTERLAGIFQAVIIGGKDFSTGQSAGPAEPELMDDTSESFLALLLSGATDNERLGGLLSLAFRKWQEGKDPEVGRKYAAALLRNYLSELSPDARLKVMLELNDTVKSPRR